MRAGLLALAREGGLAELARGSSRVASDRGGLVSRRSAVAAAIAIAFLLTTLCPTLASAIQPAKASNAPSARPSALVVFLSPPVSGSAGSEGNTIERELQAVPTLSVGILSATQGAYSKTQMLLDITQGARVSGSAYSQPNPPPLQVLGVAAQAKSASTAAGQARAVGVYSRAVGERSPSGARAAPWAPVLKRAAGAPQLLEPGSLASHIPGGGAYVPAAGVQSTDGIVVADRLGGLSDVWLGPAGTVAGIDRLLATHRLVVADLPTGPSGYADLRLLAAVRPAGELLIVIQRTPDDPQSASFDASGSELLWSAFAGLSQGGKSGGGQTLTSQTTNQRGMIAAIDIAPTVLEHLGLATPPDMRGRPVRLDGTLNGPSLRALKARLVVIASRRLPAVAWLMLTWALLLCVARLSIGSSAWALRVGALALLWAPVGVLAPAALEPSRTGEFVLIVGGCFALGALADLLLPWPRAPLAPAVTAVLALSADALAGTQLLMRSLLGPSPAFGARFYGIGNELKSGLAVLVFCAVAAALYPAVRGRRAAGTMAGAGVVLAIVEGSARIGAGVGGVILVSAGTAVASIMLLAGTLSRKRMLIVMAAPLLGLIALAAIDLATAHGSGHFTGSVLDARSPADIRDIIVRRYSAAWDELKNHLMPLATAVALLASVLAIRDRDRLLAPVDRDPAWLAALTGGLTSGVIGALTEDSGPVLLVVAVATLGCMLSYLWGKPLAEEQRARNPSRAVRAGTPQHDLML